MCTCHMALACHMLLFICHRGQEFGYVGYSIASVLYTFTVYVRGALVHELQKETTKYMNE